MVFDGIIRPAVKHFSNLCPFVTHRTASVTSASADRSSVARSRQRGGEVARRRGGDGWLMTHACAARSWSSSSFVHGSLRISGLRWLCHLHVRASGMSARKHAGCHAAAGLGIVTPFATLLADASWKMGRDEGPFFCSMFGDQPADHIILLRNHIRRNDLFPHRAKGLRTVGGLASFCHGPLTSSGFSTFCHR